MYRWLCLSGSWHSTASRQSTAAWSSAQAAKHTGEVQWEGKLSSLMLWLDNLWYPTCMLAGFNASGHIYWFKTSFSTSAVPYSQHCDSRYEYTPSWSAWGWWVGWLAPFSTLSRCRFCRKKLCRRTELDYNILLGCSLKKNKTFFLMFISLPSCLNCRWTQTREVVRSLPSAHWKGYTFLPWISGTSSASPEELRTDVCVLWWQRFWNLQLCPDNLVHGNPFKSI